MRKFLMFCIVTLLVISLTACKDKSEEDNVDQSGLVVVDGTVQTAMTPEGLAWRDRVLNSPVVAEIENKGTNFEVHVSDSLKYIYNTSTSELITGTTIGDVNETVLKDWISPYEQTMLHPDEALFEAAWEYTSARIRGLIGYCDVHYSLVTRARTSEYLEYIYQDTTNDITYRIAVTDNYILFAPLVFTYVFDINAY